MCCSGLVVGDDPDLLRCVVAGLWSVMTLGLAGGGKSDDGGGKGAEPDTVLANQSLLLILVLANHCTSEAELHNPYREALFSFTNSQGEARSRETSD